MFDEIPSFSYFDQVHSDLPLQAAQVAMDRFVREWPAETESSETPPGMRKGKPDSLDFELVLGRYDPSTRRVTVWTRGIEEVGAIIGLHPMLLKRIVRLHESAHAVHHLGYRREASRDHGTMVAQEARSSAIFEALDAPVAEQVAQLATYVALRAQRDRATTAKGDVDAMVSGFRRLMGRQSLHYRLPEAIDDMQLDRLRGKLALLLELVDGGAAPTPGQVAGILD